MKIKKIKIKSITPVNNEDVYDLTVEGNHNFIGDNIVVHNCGEIFMQEYDACRLMAINLYSFVENPFTENAKINYEKLYKISYEQQRLADDLVDLELEKIEKIIKKIENDTEPPSIKSVELNLWKNIHKVASSGRRTGCGFTALGDMIAAMNFKYDSEEANKLIEEVMKSKMRGELDCTIDLSVIRGSFTGFDKDLEYIDGVGANDFYKFIKKAYKAQHARMIISGRRNISISTVAPTGSLSILTQTTSGMEPVFSIFPYLRRKKLNPNDKNSRIDFIDENGDKWTEFSVIHKGLIDYIKINHLNDEIIDLFEKEDKTKDDEERLVNLSVDFIKNNKTPYSDSSANDINWVKRVQIQGIIQKYTTHSISSTINLPNDVKKDEVSKIYLNAWESKLKGVTVYRDGCRSGVLITKKENKNDEIVYNDAPKRPEFLPCEIYHPKVRGKTYTVIVGLLKNKPYEVFTLDAEIGIGYNKGKINKVKKGKTTLYNLVVVDKTNSDIEFKNIGSYMSDIEEFATRSTSGNLRHGMHIKYIVEQLLRGNGDITSFTKVMARILKKYIPDGTKSSKKTCDECGAKDSIVYEEGCSRCKVCGYSKCG